jgi:hypothetical protein
LQQSVKLGEKSAAPSLRTGISDCDCAHHTISSLKHKLLLVGLKKMRGFALPVGIGVPNLWLRGRGLLDRGPHRAKVTATPNGGECCAGQGECCA